MGKEPHSAEKLKGRPVWAQRAFLHLLSTEISPISQFTYFVLFPILEENTASKQIRFEHRPPT